jgi:hypothetical protein
MAKHTSRLTPPRSHDSHAKPPRGAPTLHLLLLIASLLCMPAITLADTLSYSGETTDKTSYPVASGGSDSLWDYVYSIPDWNSMNTPKWGIVCPVVPVWHDETAGWTYTYYSAIPYLGDKYKEIEGQPGIIWEATGSPDNADYFHFQSTYFPVHQPYDGNSWTNKTEYSANPEPASMALTALALGAVILRRRRREAA